MSHWASGIGQVDRVDTRIAEAESRGADRRGTGFRCCPTRIAFWRSDENSANPDWEIMDYR
jgi:hypothetical protein